MEMGIFEPTFQWGSIFGKADAMPPKFEIMCINENLRVLN